MKHGSLFSGIGGFDLAAEWMGWENVFHCENNKFGQKILKKHWPNAKSYSDIKQTDFAFHRGGIDIITGGFPCQPFSNAGEMLGDQDERFLFAEMLRCARETQATWIVGENVYGITAPKFNETFESICSSMEAEGYQVQPYIIPASAIKANHQRERVWFIAYSSKNASSKKSNNKKEPGQNKDFTQKEVFRDAEYISKGWSDLRSDMSKPDSIESIRDVIKFKTKPLFFGESNGISRRLDENTEQSLGNAIVPGVAFEIFKTIEDFNKLIKR